MKLTHDILDQFRLIGDKEADQLVSYFYSHHRQGELYRVLQLSLSQIINEKGEVAEFLLSVRKNPAWYDEISLQRGQQFFKEYAAEIMMLLGLKSLPYCYAASPGNKALFMSDKMRGNPGKRLLDTAAFIIGVSSPNCFSSNALGFVHINKTRLIHAIARHHVSRRDWQSLWGLPINQEDMAGTNLAFSLLILIGLEQSGLIVSDRQKEDFITLWRYIGFQLCIDEQLLPTTFMDAFRLAQWIERRHFKKSAEGLELTRELINYYSQLLPTAQVRFVPAQMRHYLGDTVADILGIEPGKELIFINSIFSSVKEFKNWVSLHSSSYDKMLTNHQLLNSRLK